MKSTLLLNKKKYRLIGNAFIGVYKFPLLSTLLLPLVLLLLRCPCIGHFHSLKLTMDFSDLWKHSFRFTHATLHTISKCAAYRYQRSLPRCISSGVTDGDSGANCSHGKINAKTGPPHSILLGFSGLLFLCIFWSVFWWSRIDMYTDHIDGHAHQFGFTIISQLFNWGLGVFQLGFPTLDEASSYAIVHSLTKRLHSKVTCGKTPATVTWSEHLRTYCNIIVSQQSLIVEQCARKFCNLTLLAKK